MIKKLILIFTLLLPVTGVANEWANYKFYRKFPVKTGRSTATIIETNDTNTLVNIKYRLSMWFAGVKTGDSNEWYENKFFEEWYYEDLKEKGTVDEESFTVTYKGVGKIKTDKGTFECYKLFFKSKDRDDITKLFPWITDPKRWDAYVWYTPEVSVAGWAKVKISIKGVSGVGTLHVNAILKDFEW